MADDAEITIDYDDHTRASVGRSSDYEELPYLDSDDSDDEKEEPRRSTTSYGLTSSQLTNNRTSLIQNNTASSTENNTNQNNTTSSTESKTASTTQNKMYCLRVRGDVKAVGGNINMIRALATEFKRSNNDLVEINQVDVQNLPSDDPIRKFLNDVQLIVHPQISTPNTNRQKPFTDMIKTHRGYEEVKADKPDAVSAYIYLVTSLETVFKTLTSNEYADNLSASDHMKVHLAYALFGRLGPKFILALNIDDRKSILDMIGKLDSTDWIRLILSDICDVQTTNKIKSLVTLFDSDDCGCEICKIRV